MVTYVYFDIGTINLKKNMKNCFISFPEAFGGFFNFPS